MDFFELPCAVNDCWIGVGVGIGIGVERQQFRFRPRPDSSASYRFLLVPIYKLSYKLKVRL